ncbi:hypothetical protein SAMN05444166_6282 [Singulisphaera sp. GP187]|uniref:hypothetical protein n=1 Tax=Singulisphaera sp. GP187 TaxID=1882752 RepID=UPI000925E06B|nr:hypothetical protein [Singulisphaera sp. GP187]SIO60141.1 hypothetical protein SAMN05444166_6282 [Singulisphaera sp. GP187]
MSLTHRQALSITTNGANSIGGSDLEVGNAEIVLDQTFTGGTANQLVTLAFTAAALQSVVLVATSNLTIRTNGSNETKRITVTGTPTGGTLTSTVNGQTTAAIVYNATAAAVQAALEALSNVAVGGAICTGGPLPGTPVNVTFTGNLGLQTVTMSTTDSFSGGSSPASAVTTPTPGVAPSNTVNLIAGNPLVWGRSPGYFANPFTADVSSISVSCTTSCRLQGKILTS